MEQIYLNDETYDYIKAMSPPEPDLLARLREETQRTTRPFWQISWVQGRFMTVLTKLAGASRIVEVGTFTGYSSICMAWGMAPGGRMTCLDIDKDFTDIARRYWKEAGLDDRIELRLKPGVDGLNELIAEEGEGSVDLMFVDADKANYQNYFDLGMKLVRSGGLIVVDNTLFSGRVVGQGLEGLADWQLAWTESVKEFNKTVRDTEGVDYSMVPLGDGMSFFLKH